MDAAKPMTSVATTATSDNCSWVMVLVPVGRPALANTTSLPGIAFHDNRSHHHLAEDARPEAVQELDPGEDVAVVTLTAAQIRDCVERGEVDHSLVLSALCRVLDLRVRAGDSASG